MVIKTSGMLSYGFLYTSQQTMERDPRYKAVKLMVESGEITKFNEMFRIIPKSIVAADLGKQNIRFTMLMNRIERFTLKDLFLLGKFFELDERMIFELAYQQYLQQKTKKSI